MRRKSFLFFFLLCTFIFALSGKTIANDPPTACFTADLLTGDIPLLVSFIDASSGEIYEWEWDFGDESELSYLQNPMHTYTTAGTFVVTLTVTGPGGSSYANCEIVTYAPLVACFTTESTPGTFPFEVDFIDASTGQIVSWCWDFGDESPLSYEQNPTHTYYTEGTYNATLEITDIYSVKATASCEVKVKPIWQSNEYGHVYGTNPTTGNWKIALVKVGFKSVEADKWHVIYLDNPPDLGDPPDPKKALYTDEPYSNYQWWDKTILQPDDWPNGNAEDFEIVSPTPQPEPDQKFPICYTSGSTMQVKLVIKTSGSPNIEAFKGFQSTSENKKVQNGFVFPETPIANPILLNCSKAFDAGKVSYFEELKIQWMVKIDGKWGNLAPSKNQCYATLAEPLVTTLYHTVAHFACAYASGESTMDKVVSKIWDKFKAPTSGTPSQIFRAQDKYINPSNDVMIKYWGAGIQTPSPSTTSSLLLNADGRCGAWARLFRDILRSHGDNSAVVKTIITKNDGVWHGNGFLIYQNLPGQNNPTPHFNFTNHAIVEYNEKLYDPSYGKIYDTILLWEDASVNKLDYIHSITSVEDQRNDTKGVQETDYE